MTDDTMAVSGGSSVPSYKQVLLGNVPPAQNSLLGRGSYHWELHGYSFSGESRSVRLNYFLTPWHASSGGTPSPGVIFCSGV